jgi:hypothetical protein
VQFKRNGRCVQRGGGAASAAAPSQALALGGCYIARGSADNTTMWSAGDASTGVRSWSGALCALASAAGGFELAACGGGAQELAWSAATTQLVLGSSGNCAGDHGGLALQSCAEQTTKGWAAASVPL